MGEPTRYEVLGPESVTDHEAVYQFIEVLSPPSKEATDAIVAHSRLLNRLSNVLERVTTLEAELAEANAVVPGKRCCYTCGTEFSAERLCANVAKPFLGCCQYTRRRTARNQVQEGKA